MIREDFSAQLLMGLQPAISHEKFSGAGLRARQAVRTGWKAGATWKNFSR